MSSRRAGRGRRRLLAMLLAVRVLLAVRHAGPAAVMKIPPAAARQRDGRDGVFEDQLLLRSGLKYHRVLVEALDSPRKLYPAHQIDRDVASFFAGTVEKAVLYCVLLLRSFFHLIDSPSKKLLGYLKPNTTNSLRARVCLAMVYGASSGDQAPAGGASNIRRLLDTRCAITYKLSFIYPQKEKHGC